MRKGADCLSKWVGEAERQLRLLFEEAKNAQPSIIFFDEIDGTHMSRTVVSNEADDRSQVWRRFEAQNKIKYILPWLLLCWR